MLNEVRYSIGLFILFFCLHFSVCAQTPIANFTSIPSATNDTIRICLGDSIRLINTSTSTITGSTYAWNFGSGATPTTYNGAGPVAVFYNTVTAGRTIQLTVNNNNTLPLSTKTMVVIVSPLPTSNISLVSSGNGFGSSVQNGITLFKNCNAADSSIFFFQSNYSNAVNQTFDWGDGTTSNNISMIGTQINHKYNLGKFDFFHTVTLASGCKVIKKYIVFNGKAPIITVSGAGQNTCIPSPYSFDLISNDVPIDFTVNYSDGSMPLVFTTSVDTTIDHVFNSSSCGTDYVYLPGQPPIKNAFSGTIVAQNACSNNGIPTVITIGPITISIGTKAKFSYSPNSPICQSEIVTFKNLSQRGQSISGSGCDTTYSFYWKLNALSGYNITAGTIGANNGSLVYTDWTSGSDELKIRFDTIGIFTMWIYSANSCGTDSFSLPIEIKPVSYVTVNTPPQTICSGDSTIAIKMTASIAGYNIIWKVIDSNNVTGILINNASGVTPLTINPMVLYNNTNLPGTVKLSASVGCTNQPNADYTILVNPRSNIIATPLQSFICSGSSTNIALSSNIPSTTFSWTAKMPNTIKGDTSGYGNMINQQLINNGSQTDTVIYTITPTNTSCPGPKVKAIVLVQPKLKLSANPDTTVCPQSTISPLAYVSNPLGALINWNNTNAAIGLGLSGTGNIPSWVAAYNYSLVATKGTIIVSAQLNNCPPTFDTFDVTINPTPKFSNTLSPPSGLSCIINTCQIIGASVPVNCAVKWSGANIINGDTSFMPTIASAGIYNALIKNNATGCLLDTTVTIDPPTTIKITNIAKQDIHCNGESNGEISITTDNTSSALSYKWIPNVSNSNIGKGLKAGNYSVVVTNDDNCKDSSNVFLNEPDSIMILVKDTLTGECGEFNGFIKVEAYGGRGLLSFQWNNGQVGPDLFGIDEGIYSVKVTDESNCTRTALYNIDCHPLLPLIVPQFISPNSDKLNDLWLIEHTEQYPNLKVQVFNRWGNIVYASESYKNDWNGNYYNGETEVGPLPAGTYFYLIDTKKKSQEPIRGFIEIQP